MGRAFVIVAAGIIVGLLIVWMVLGQVPSSVPRDNVTGAIRRPEAVQPNRR